MAITWFENQLYSSIKLIQIALTPRQEIMKKPIILITTTLLKYTNWNVVVTNFIQAELLKTLIHHTKNTFLNFKF